MKLLAISVGLPRTIEVDGRSVTTGIFKEPVEGPVHVGSTGVAGDGQADLEAHGGADKAVYVYTIEHYRFWQQALKCSTMPFGQFGENLTVEEMPDDRVHIGDRFRIGQLLVEVTQPRVPCFKLGIRMNRPDFPRRFMHSGRTGFYFRVLEEGELSAGEAIERISMAPIQLTIQESMQALIPGPNQRGVIESALEVDALSQAWRDDLEKRLRKLS
jgi:MOSC domain-containing protein YiiM